MDPSPSAWARVKSLFLRASEASHPSVVLAAETGSVAQAARQMMNAKSADLTLPLDEIGRLSDAVSRGGWLFAPGTLVASRFEIVRPLGRGGMGEVYEARDNVKEVSIALKVVLPNSGIDPETADRLFRREVSLAQLVSHPNICRIYDPYVHHPDQGPPMLTVSMELLRGRTLAAILLERGRMDAEEAAEIARELAAGIDAAHAVGVVHRDLKPSNILVVDEDGRQRAVITDFGLARRATGQTVTQLSSAVAGTLRYMAPEQIQGRGDKRSDLYSFTFILYEVLTGQLPFAGDSDLSLALNRLSHPPIDPATVLPHISIAWRTALLKGLSREPERRFQTAGALVRAVQTPPPLVLLWPELLLLRVRGARPLVRWLWACLLVAALACAGFLLKPAPSPFPPFSRILVARIEHPAKGDSAMLGTEASLAAAIGQSPHLAVARPSEFAVTLAKMGLRNGDAIPDSAMRQLAMRTGETAVLFGSISKGKRYSLRLRLEAMGVNTNRAAISVEKKFEATDEKDLFTAIASAAGWVRKLSGEGARELNEQNVRPEDLTTGSWEASRLLQEAHARRSANDPRGAIVFAGEALDLDPDFAAAEAFKADAQTNLRQYREAFDSYRRALELAKKRNVTGRERYQIEATYQQDAGDDEGSLRTYAAWIAHFPQDYLPHFFLGYQMFSHGDYPSALAEMQEARRLGPFQAFILPHLAAIYLANEQFDQAQQCAGELRQLGENDWAIEVDGLVQLGRHRFQEAADTVRPLASRGDGVFPSVAPLYVASALADAGRLHEAEQTLLSVSSETDANSRARFADRYLRIAFLRWLQGDRTGTRAALVAIIDDLDNPQSLALAAALFARVGDLQAAGRILPLMNRWPPIPLASKASDRIRTEIALAAHRSSVSVLAAKIQQRLPSPLDWECLLHVSLAEGKPELSESIRGQIRRRKDILLSWDEGTTPPGLYWLASCESPCRPR